MMEKQNMQRDVYIVDGARTPFLKARNKPGPLSAGDLALQAGRELLARQTFLPTDLDEVIIGCVMPNPEEANIARLIALRLGCGDAMPAFTVQRNCASGMQALDSAVKDIASGRHDLVLAGGTEAMSRAPLLYNSSMVNWFSGMWAAKSFGAKAKLMGQFRPYFLKPVIALLKGLTDFTVNLNMGQTAENLAYRFNITREEMDSYALESHKRAAFAADKHLLTEITATFGTNGDYFTEDDGVRRETTLEKLGTLKPIFDKKFGSVTAGNSSQVTDGAALLILASKDAVQKYNLPVLARISGTEWAGLNPAEMGLGPVYAGTQLLKKHNLSLEDINFWEINEAFAAQVLACIAAWESDSYCQQFLGLDGALGSLDLGRLNVDGGGVALGHPVGASGARIVLRLAHILKRNNAQRGVAAICIGGGQGGAVLIENVSEVNV
jgi:acetyl-CoA C-acetyltransferase